MGATKDTAREIAAGVAALAAVAGRSKRITQEEAREKGYISAIDYAGHLCISHCIARKDLQRLVKQGRAEKVDVDENQKTVMYFKVIK